MKRDMELVRKILLAMEAYEHAFAPPDFTVPGYDHAVIGHHVWLMEQGDLITAATSTVHGDGSPVALPGTITWAGHEFLDTIRNEAVWAKVIEIEARGISLSFTSLKEFGTKILAWQVGLPHD